jgi:para-aminobenzoate synthetase
MTANDPVAAFRDTAATYRRCFWLDGGGARDWSGRRSLIGWLDPDDVSLTYSAATGEVTRHTGGSAQVVGDDVFAVLEAELVAGSTRDQWFGYLGYAANPDLPARPSADVPDAVWMRPSHVRLFEHPVVTGRPADRPPGELITAPPEYSAAFDRVREHLYAGNSYEVNLTHRIEVSGPSDPATVYLRLRDLNPAPYAGFLQHDVDDARAWLLSSSPERYALITRGDDGRHRIETKPIKGTTPRGHDAAGDEAEHARLASDPKFRAENLMIVDLLRNDLSMVCDPGTVEVPSLMAVESYETVHQLVSTVRGRLNQRVTTIGALRALFPAGSMTGAPKLRTMQIINEVESTPRGAYAGAFGWIAADGRADLGVIIRSLTTTGDGTYRLGTGGGITVHSQADEEYAEAHWKAERLLTALSADVSPGDPWPS